MSRNYKFHNPEGIYFVSFAVVGWLDVFTRRAYIDIFIDSIHYCQKNKGMEVFAWCIMTNHIHLIYRSVGEESPGAVLRAVKQFTSSALVKAIHENPRESRKILFLKKFKNAAKKSSNVKNYQFWRHDNNPIELWSSKIIDEKLRYVHDNPVKGGYVEFPEDYLYSSARDYAGEQGLINDIVLIR